MLCLNSSVPLENLEVLIGWSYTFYRTLLRCSSLAIVKPETVVAWHRTGFRRFWNWKVRRGQPGQRVIAREVRD